MSGTRGPGDGSPMGGRGASPGLGVSDCIIWPLRHPGEAHAAGMQRGSSGMVPSAPTATGRTAIQAGRAATRCAGHSASDRATWTAVQATSPERTSMGAETAAGARQHDGRVDAGRGRRHWQCLSLADGEQRCGSSNDKTDNLHRILS
jgi:hypothetical protein